jgi:hypothetical protein
VFETATRAALQVWYNVSSSNLVRILLYLNWIFIQMLVQNSILQSVKTNAGMNLL